MIDALETCFSKYAHSTEAYEETVNEMLATYKFTFPCSQHAEEIVAYSIKYYLTMRMRQFTYQINTNEKNKSQQKRKEAKFYST